MVVQDHELHFKFLGPLMSTGLLLELVSGQTRRIDGCGHKNKRSVACARRSLSPAGRCAPATLVAASRGTAHPHTRQH